MFYWYFPIDESRNTSMSIEDRPFMVWLTGGPGCSSELAVLTENGPLTIHPDVTVTRNPYTWSSVGDIVFIDQPLGTGFSHVGDPRNYVTTEKLVASDMREFLVQFLELYPELKNRPFYITGESYAGHYIPSVAHLLLKSPIEGLNLQGIAIGNGWVDPREQYPAYADFALAHNMVGEVGYHLAQKAFQTCIQLIDQGLWILAIVQCNSVVSGLLGKKNPYDVRLDCETPPMCYNTTALDTFLNRNDVQEALGVDKKWKECNALVYALMLGDWVHEMGAKVGELLTADKRVLIYSGDQDFICNWMGGEAWVNNVEWGRQDEFLETEYVEWAVNGKAYGAMRHVDNLTFLRLYDSGHMAPMDQPVASLEMISRFLSNTLTPQPPQPSHDDKPEKQQQSVTDLAFDYLLQNVESIYLAVS